MTTNQIAYRNSLENNRHNLQTEQQNWQNVFENVRHNLATETEMHRSNITNEGNQRYNLDTMRQHYQRQDDEAVRHNISTEALSQWYNTQSIANQNWSNAIQSKNVTLQARDRWASNLTTRERDKNSYEVDVERNNITSANNLWNYALGSQNADTNAKNADINQQNADINQQNADIARYRFYNDLLSTWVNNTFKLLPWY